MSEDLNKLIPNPTYGEAYTVYKDILTGGLCCLLEPYSWATARQGYFDADMDEAISEYFALKEQGIFNIPYG